MDSLDAYALEYTPPKPVVKAENLPSDTIIEAVTMAGELQESAEYGELSNITSKLTPEGLSVVNSRSFDDPESFAADYYGLPAQDVDTINQGIREGHERAVTNMSAEKVAKDITTQYDLEVAKNAVDTLRKLPQRTKKLEDPDFQMSLQMTGGEWNYAETLWGKWKKFKQDSSRINANFIWEYAKEKHKFKVPDKWKNVEALKRDIQGGDLVPADIRWASASGYSNKAVEQIIAQSDDPKEMMVNYAMYLKQAQKEYGIPYDFEGKTIGDEKGVKATMPIFSGIAAAMTGGGSLIPRWALGSTAFLGDAVLDDALDYAEDLPDNIFVRGTASVAMIMAFALGEVGAAKVLASPKSTVVKAGNIVTFAARAAKQIPEAVKLSPEVMDGVFKSIFNGTPMSKAVPTPNKYSQLAELCVPYVPTEPPKMVGFSVTKDNMMQVNYAAKAHAANEFKQNVKGFQRQQFGGSRAALDKMLSEGNLDGALEIWKNNVYDAHMYSRGVVNNTVFDFNVKPNFLMRAWNGLAPKEFKEYGVYLPNSMVNWTNSLDSQFRQLADYVNSGLTKTERDTLGRMIHELDSGVPIQNIGDIPEKVAQAHSTYTRIMDEGASVLNKVYEQQCKDADIWQTADGSLVSKGRLNKEGKFSCIDIQTGEVLHLAESELNPVKQYVKTLDHYMKRVDKSKHIVWEALDDGTHKAFKSVMNREAAYLAEKELLDSGKQGVITRSGELPSDASRYARSSSLVYADKARAEQMAEDMEKIMDEFSAMGYTRTEALEMSDAAMEVVAKNLNMELSRVRNIIKKPAGGVYKKRTRDVALGQYGDENIGNYMESMNAWSMGLSETIMAPYVKSMKDAFIEQFGKHLDNPKDYTSKLNKVAGDETGHVLQAGKLVQRQIMNMERIPDAGTLLLRDITDQTYFRIYKSEIPVVKQVGKVLDKLNEKVLNTGNIRGFGYASTMWMNLQQVWKQMTFGVYGLAAHADEFAKNPKLAANTLSKSAQIGEAFSLGKLGKRLQESGVYDQDFKMLWNAIEDRGWMSDLLGTELTDNMGFWAKASKFGMKPVVLGEGGNRTLNIALAWELGKSKGLKAGSQEHLDFVGTYFPKYSQVLNHLTNSPLASSALTSWNVGSFMKFPLNFTNQFWFETSKKQKVLIGGTAYALLGPEGIPGVSDLKEATETVHNQFAPAVFNMEMNFHDWVHETSQEEIEAYIDTLYMSDEDKTALKESTRERAESRAKIIEDLKNTRALDVVKIGTNFEGMEDKNLTGMDLITNLPSAIWNYKGVSEDVSTQIGFASKLQQVRDYGLGSAALGPATQAFSRLRLGDTFTMLTEGKTYNSTRDFLKDTAYRISQQVFVGSAKHVDGMLKLWDLSEKLDSKELRDVDGNLVDWVDVFEGYSTLKLDVDYTKSSYKQTAPVVEREWMTFEDAVITLKGGVPKDIKERKRIEGKIYKNQKYILEPLLKTKAELCDSLVATGKPESIEEAGEIMSTVLAAITKQYESGGPSVPDWAYKFFQSEMHKLSVSRTMRDSLKNRVRRDSMKKIVEGEQ